MRKDKIAELIIDKIESINLTKDDVLIINIPQYVIKEDVQILGAGIVEALRSSGKNNYVIALPENVKLSQINEKDMKNYGWIKDPDAELKGN